MPFQACSWFPLQDFHFCSSLDLLNLSSCLFLCPFKKILFLNISRNWPILTYTAIHSRLLIIEIRIWCWPTLVRLIILIIKVFEIGSPTELRIVLFDKWTVTTPEIRRNNISLWLLSDLWIMVWVWTVRTSIIIYFSMWTHFRIPVFLYNRVNLLDIFLWMHVLNIEVPLRQIVNLILNLWNSICLVRTHRSLVKSLLCSLAEVWIGEESLLCSLVELWTR